MADAMEKIREMAPGPPQRSHWKWIVLTFVVAFIVGMGWQYYIHEKMTAIADQRLGRYTFEMFDGAAPVIIQAPLDYQVRRINPTESGHWALFAIQRRPSEMQPGPPP